ncbi:hypothetical protein PMAYCL1PPCAC_10353, partial [Pristionchus mayeri]
KMQIPILLLSIGLVTCYRTPLVLTPQQKQKATEIFGAKLNLTAAVDVVAEEAMWLSITSEEHWKECFDREEKDSDEISISVEKWKTGIFTNPDKMQDVIKKQLPTNFAGISKMLGENLSNLEEDFSKLMAKIEDQAVANYINEIKSAFLAVYAECSKVKDDANKWIPIIGKALGKVFEKYDTLSHSSLKILERATCFKTTLRIMDNFVGAKGEMSKIQNKLSHFISMSKVLEKLGE